VAEWVDERAVSKASILDGFVAGWLESVVPAGPLVHSVQLRTSSGSSWLDGKAEWAPALQRGTERRMRRKTFDVDQQSVQMHNTRRVEE
jgi:hypothetical protein